MPRVLPCAVPDSDAGSFTLSRLSQPLITIRTSPEVHGNSSFFSTGQFCIVNVPISSTLLSITTLSRAWQSLNLTPAVVILRSFPETITLVSAVQPSKAVPYVIGSPCENPVSEVQFLNAFGFDASVKNIFAPLLVGGTLILGSRDLYNIDSILGIMRTYRPTVVNCVPGLFSALTEADREKNYNAVSSLEYAVLGGERLNNSWAIQLYKDISESKLKVLNVYGPTECTSVSSSMKYTLREFAECENVLSGRPIYNKRIYILDDKGNVFPKGEKGEIVISGVGIADNYIDHKREDVFLKDNFFADDRMYKSGDIGY